MAHLGLPCVPAHHPCPSPALPCPALPCPTWCDVPWATGAPFDYRTVDLHNKSEEFVSLYRSVVCNQGANAVVSEWLGCIQYSLHETEC